MINLPVVDNSIKNKKVLVRGDIDIPDGDFFRLEAIKPTIDFLLQNNNKVILCGHRGRPNGKVVPELSTKIIADYFENKFPVLENLRFDPREEANDESLARELAGLAEVYVNEAFATSFENHASIVGVPKLLPPYAGFRLAKEVAVLTKVLENPARPLLVIIGGAKIETKQPLITKMKNFADAVIVSPKIEDSGPGPRLGRGKQKDKDISLNLISNFKFQISNSRTIVWNGPFGQIEDEKYQAGTKKLVELILANKEAYKIVGGGDTVGFLQKNNLLAGFDFVSTGGGSMLKFLSGEELPGLLALTT